MAKYQAYAEYKDSGGEWLGVVPSHWIITTLKRYCYVKGGFAFSSDAFIDTGYPVIRIGDIKTDGSINLENCKYIPESLAVNSRDYLVEKNQLLMAMTGATIGKAGLYTSNQPAFLNQRVGKFELLAQNMNYRYLWYILKTDGYQEYIKLTAFGGAQPNISDTAMVDYPATIPSFDEQTQIAHFLDHETTKIDHLIEKQQQLIELLKEKRQAVISHAVTKGLDPNIPMKDSGVEWLGEVPEHWTVTRAKFVSDIFVPQRNKPELNDMEGYSWVTMDDMKNKYIQSVNRYVTKNSAMLAGSKILKKRAVIASCVGNFGITSINNIDVIINQQLQAFIPRNIKAEYLQNLVSISKKYFELIGTAATLVYVNQEGFQNLPVLLPPYDEQVAICVQIENDENKYDQLIHLGLKQIKILQERRTALISSAVTGKIDLRNWQSPTVAEAQTEFSA